MAKIRLTQNVWSILAGAVFFLAGFFKIYSPTEAMAQFQLREFEAFSANFPTRIIGLNFRPDPVLYRLILGAVNMTVGVIVLLCPPPPVAKMCYAVMYFVMLGAVLSQLGRENYPALVVPVVFTGVISMAWRALNMEREKID